MDVRLLLLMLMNYVQTIGDGWRLPNANELLLSYVYRDALGGDATQGSGYAGQNIFGWYTNWTSNYWSSSSYLDLGDTKYAFYYGFLKR
ncbi:MAG: hypothetical protein V8R28_14630 [Bacteroides cellulosilyticus]